MTYTFGEKLFLTALAVVFFVTVWTGWKLLHKDIPEGDWFIDWQIEQPIWIIEGGSLC